MAFTAAASAAVVLAASTAHDSGGFHAGGYGGDRFGGFDAGGFHEGGLGGSLNRGQLNSFLGLPTNAGMHAAGGAAGHVYQGPRGDTVAHGPAAHEASLPGRGGAVAGRGVRLGAWLLRRRRHALLLAHLLPCPGHGGPTLVQRLRLLYARLVYVASLGLAPGGIRPRHWAEAAWTVPAAAAVGAWLGSAAAPSYQYDYGDNVTYQDGDVYYGSQLAGTQQQYYQEAANLAGADPAADSGQAQWMPLGVFGLIAQGQKTPDMVFQLALDKAGAIRGNYYDQVSDATAPVTGAVNKKDQRVAWRVRRQQDLGRRNRTVQPDPGPLHRLGPLRAGPDAAVRAGAIRETRTTAAVRAEWQGGATGTCTPVPRRRQ